MHLKYKFKHIGYLYIVTGLHSILLVISYKRKLSDAGVGNIATPLASISKFCGVNFIVTSILTEE